MTPATLNRAAILSLSHHMDDIAWGITEEAVHELATELRTILALDSLDTAAKVVATYSAPVLLEDMRAELQAAVAALKEIATADMPGVGQEPVDIVCDEHGRKAWEFIAIATEAFKTSQAFLEATCKAKNG